MPLGNQVDCQLQAHMSFPWRYMRPTEVEQGAEVMSFSFLSLEGPVRRFKPLTAIYCQSIKTTSL